ncbi:MAG: sigma-54-dependent Fis family transcriptional regulator [Candidatus Latescibacteria bacterium]|nr:sigma-54-dependent Fis family transcriptional regulator [Candidatus Latescibacterota bacterium]
MSIERTHGAESTAIEKRLEELISHARFGAALDLIAEIQSGGALPAELGRSITLARCRALLGLGRWREVAEAAERVLEELYAHEPGDKKAILEFHIAAGRAVWRIGRPSRAEEHFRAAYHISRWDFEDLEGMLRSRNLLGLCFLSAGEIQRAVGEFVRGQLQARGAGLYHEEANFSLNLSIALAKLGQFEQSDYELNRARSLFGERGHSRGKVQTRLCLGQRLRIQGDLRGAETQVRGALSEAEEHGFEREHVIALEYLGDVALDRYDNQTAIERYDQGLLLAERLAPEGDLIPELCRRLAEVHVRIGEPNRALITCERGLRVARRINDRFEEAATCRVMAMANQILGHRERALRVAREGIQLLRKLEAGYELMRMLVWSGEALLAGGDAEERRAGRDYLWEARSLAMTMNLDRWVERIEKVLGVELQPAPPSQARRSGTAQARPDRADPDCFRFGIVTQDPRIVELIRILDRAAASRLPILILGERGCGKELLARAAHELGERRNRPFVVGRCASLPEGHLDADLFGQDRVVGLGTGATRAGLFEAANGGEIYLDEVSELLVGAQAKLLRVIEMGELRRVGAAGVRQVDVRVIAASTRDLASLVRRGLFRDDLYYRLNGIRLEMPPLRDRADDIELIGRYVLGLSCAQAKKEVALTEEAWAELRVHTWPGNVQELKASIERTVALAQDGDRIGPELVPIRPTRRSTGRAPSPHRSSARSENRSERDQILMALRAHDGNQSEAARSLGNMKRTTLLYKMKKLDIRPEEYGSTA